MQLEIQLAVTLCFFLVADRVFVRVRGAGPDFVIIVQHWTGIWFFLVRCRVHHQPALLGKLSDIGFGWIGLA
jgi:hypothetical protein